MTQETIKATNENIRDIVKSEVERLGDDADLNHIDVSGVTDMSRVFSRVTFSGNVSDWNVSNVVDMSAMFRISRFSADISDWDVSGVTDMRGMFEYAKFNQDISGWDVSNVKSMRGMFEESTFDGDISKWNVSATCDTKWMFTETSIPVGRTPKTLQDSLIRNTDNMIKATDETIHYIAWAEIQRLGVEADLNHIDVSEVTNMRALLIDTQFKGDISKWDISNVVETHAMFSSDMPEENKPKKPDEKGI